MQMLKTSVVGSFLRSVKVDTVSPMARHRLHVSLKLCCSGAKVDEPGTRYMLRGNTASVMKV